ncbi:MAG: CpsD/CapB family tyrosine-protein kinase [Steroidobacteraceae bacterium]
MKSLQGHDLSRTSEDAANDHSAVELSSVRAIPIEGPQRQTRMVEVSTALLDQQRVLRPGAGGAAGAAWKMLRTQVLKRLDKSGSTTLAIVSPRSGDGKTTTAINLAVALACDSSRTVLLVDLDLRRPGIAKRMGVEIEAGVEDYLEAHAPIERLLFHPIGYERMVILPARASVDNSSELLMGGRARELARELKSRYANRIILYDLPPVLEADDALAFMPNVDAALMVVRERRTQRDDIVSAMDLLRDTPIVGTVLNGSREDKSRPY